jgi:lambda family phage portal protein
MSGPTNFRRLKALSSSAQIGEVSVTADSSHMGASVHLREIASWQPGYGSADADTLPDLSMLLSRSRDLERNNGIADGGAQTLSDNIVGTGLTLRPDPDYTELGKTKEWAQDWSRRTASLWRSHAGSVEVDAARSLNFAGLCTQALRGAISNGDAIALPLWVPRQSSRFSTCLQLIESDRLSNPYGQIDSTHLRGGIELDDRGAPQAYWIRKQHPGDIYLSFLSPKIWEWDRIPAETSWGRQRVLHLHDKERTGQTRGKPLISSVIPQFKMLDHYERTELQAAVVNAMIAAFIETPLDSATMAEMMGADTESPKYQAYLAQRREYVAPLKGGAIIPVLPGDKITPFTPGRPAAAFGPFTENIARRIGLAYGLPYELLMKDWSKTNYSSARAAVLEAWRFFLGRRKWLADYLATPYYDLWLEEAVNLGLIDAPGFYTHRFAYSRCRWIGPGRGWVDPVKEVQAAQLRVDGYFSTLERECAEQGLDWEEVLEQRAAEQARMNDLKLIPSAVLLSKQPQQVQQLEDEEQGNPPARKNKQK